MKRQAADALAHLCQVRCTVDCGLRIADCDETESSQERQCGVDRLLARPFEPLQRAWIAAPRDHVERGARQIDAVDLRLAMRPQAIARIPQAPDHARSETPGAPGPLVCGVHRDPFGFQAVESALGVVPGDLLETAVDHGRHARHRQRRFCDVRRDDDPTTD
jgi:hypothetical protein